MSKASQRVWHVLLLEKTSLMEFFGFTSLFQSNRMHFVVLNQNCLHDYSINARFLQGSIFVSSL